MRKILIFTLCLLAALPRLPATAQAAQPEKVIYLTFDDGPGPYTERLLDVLARHNAHATFFLVNTGYRMDALLNRMVQEGHGVGIHSLSHDFRVIYSSEEAFWADLRGMQELIREKTGKKPESFSFLTSDFHVFRVRLVARRLGLIAYGHASRSKHTIFYYPAFLREILAVWFYFVIIPQSQQGGQI